MAFRKKFSARWWAYQFHLWLGLTSGLVVFIVSITGCIFVFQKEISDIVYSDKLFLVPPSNGKQMDPGQLYAIAQKEIGEGVSIRNFTIPKDPTRTWEFMAFEGGNKKALTFKGSVKYYQSVHLNPYTGAVTGKTNYLNEFFVVVKYLHWSLLLNTPYGQPIVGWSTLIFVVLLITGLVLWWPKKWNSKEKKQAFSIQWKARFKRLNYDLHNVLGFYLLVPALIIALTGMVWAFQWFKKTVYVVASGSTEAPIALKGISSDSTLVFPGENQEAVKRNAINIAVAEAKRQLPSAGRYNVLLANKEQSATLKVNGYGGKETYHHRDELQFDQFSGKLVAMKMDAEKNKGEQLIEANYDIHIGAIGGLPGKILAFFASLVCASLPVTGFLIWWGKRKKQTTKNSSIKNETAAPPVEAIRLEESLV